MGIGAYRHIVTVQTLVRTPDGEGGTVDTWTDLDPPWPCAIVPASVADLERRAAATIVAITSHVVTGWYRADVTIDTRILFDGRAFLVKGIRDPDERGIVLEVFASEVVS
jgi:SPP1 family predicted phage head-tail adaptor